jgi:transcriptional regulator with XRE-family HTH domain
MKMATIVFQMEIVSPEKSYRKRLVEELILRQRRNPAYSLRSFARDLGISATALSQVLSSKRNLSKSSLTKVSDKLGLSPAEQRSYLNQLNGAIGPLDDDQFTTLSDDIFQFMSNWYYFAILSLAETGNAKSAPDWLSKHFGITALEATDAIERLLRLKLIEVNKGIILYDGHQLRTATDIPSSAARRLQHDHLELAKMSLERDPVDLRDMTSMTMAIRANRIPKAKAMIKSFRRRLSRFLETGGGENVYVLAVQLFPATKRDEK